MNPRQKAFADYYIETGNATKAAVKAGYSERTARFIGGENLTKPNIAQYIKERMEQADRKRIASADEVIAFYTAVIRGEIKDQFGLDASLADRIKAADSLMKRYNVADDMNRATKEKLDAVLRELHDASMDG